MRTPRIKKMPASRNDGTIQSWSVRAKAAPSWAASCPATRAKVPSRPWRCSLSIRSSNRRVSTIQRWSSFTRSAERSGIRVASTLPSGSSTSTRSTENDTKVVTGIWHLLHARSDPSSRSSRGRGGHPAPDSRPWFSYCILQSGPRRETVSQDQEGGGGVCVIRKRVTTATGRYPSRPGSVPNVAAGWARCSA